MKTSGFILLFILFSAAAGAQSLPEWLQGNWSGTGQQSDTQTTWTMTMQVSDTLVKVSYPSLNCSGHWRYLGVTTKGKLEFEERITADRNRACANGEIVRVSAQNGQRILVEFAHPWAPGTLIAVVLLQRLP